MTRRITITEVGPRDGLQNERIHLPTTTKVAFIEALAAAGLSQLEITSFVHPTRVPMMADAEAVCAGVVRRDGTRYVALVPNMQGYRRAVSSGCEAVAVFTAASETFNQRNIGMGVGESLERFEEVCHAAAADGVQVRGYVSTIFACPFEGPMAADDVLRLADGLLGMGCYEVSLGDTTGVGTPGSTHRLMAHLVPRLPVERLALHLHDTWGMATANVAAGLQHGIQSFDSSAGGLGGCPYAPGATGNLATEDLLYLLEGLGYETGIDLQAVVDAVKGLEPYLDHPLPSRVHQAIRARAGEGGPC